MGILCDLVIGQKADGARIAAMSSPATELGGLDLKGLDSVRFTSLHAIVSGCTFSEVLAIESPMTMASEEGPWVQTLPPEFVRALAALTAPQRRNAAEEWAATEEFALSGWSPEQVAIALDAIASLARQVGRGEAMFLWMCL